ncbi:hypothetical protein SDC9_190107 [bioreactor metagenome]|uniref:Uncharacterized protein n=1 Tax=bioreactor metagenome TaxID=1076179 RepID=A0A645HUL5_9ZZZZ
MLIESHVLNGDECVFEHVRNLFDVRPVAVFHVRNCGDQIAVHVVEITRVVGDGQLRGIQRRRRFHIRFHHAKQQPHADEADDNECENAELQRSKENGKRKRTRTFPFGKQRRILLVGVVPMRFFV